MGLGTIFKLDDEAMAVLQKIAAATDQMQNTLTTVQRTVGDADIMIKRLDELLKKVVTALTTK